MLLYEEIKLKYGGNVKYNYSNIEDMEFETLSKDLLKKYTGIDFTIFAKGKDGGIDGIYENKNEKIIFQSKHYLKTGFNGLFSTLKKTELKKAEELNPTRYILLTTVELSVGQTNKIFELFKPYIKNKSDIIDLKKIDEILDNNKEIILKYPNLWYSYEIIKEILGDNIYNHYRNKLKRLKQNFEIFVWCEQYEEVLKKIEKENIFIISGAPGVGKSTLANMLCLMYLYKGYEIYDFSCEKIDEVYKIIRQNSYDDKNVLIFLDDFLGHVILDYFGNNDNGNILLSIIKEIKNNSNIKLIATSRASILNEANEKSEKFREFNLSAEKRKMIIKIDNYSNQEKTLILYKHLKRSKLKKEFLKEFIDNKTYTKVINHQNYSPRIIEYIVNEEYEENIIGKYSDYVLENLNKPINLWEKSFENLGNDLKILFILLCSFRREISKEFLEEAYYNKEEELEDKISSFKKNLRILEGSFIKINNKNKKIYIDVINPSLRDFFTVKLNEENRLYKKIIQTAVNIEQIKYIQELRNNKNDCMEFILNCGVLSKFSEKDIFEFYKSNIEKSYDRNISIIIEEKLFDSLKKLDNIRPIEILENGIKFIGWRNYELSDLIKIKKSDLRITENIKKLDKMILKMIEEGDIEYIIDSVEYNIIVEILIEYGKLNEHLDELEKILLELIGNSVDSLEYDYCFDYDFHRFSRNCIDYVFYDCELQSVSNEIYSERILKEKIVSFIGDLKEEHSKLCIKKDRDRDIDIDLKEKIDTELQKYINTDELFEKLI